MRNKILIADDDRPLTMSLKMILETDDYIVLIVYDGISALKKAEEEKPDLIILDYDMPGMNGYEVCSSLRANQSTRYIPVIILSGMKTGSYDRIIGLQAGADDYIVKPFDSNELRARIARLIQRTKEIISLNPLTKLPGSTRIEEEITGRLNKKIKFAVCYIDLDNFKAYNDYYGYKRGDNVINLLHSIIFEGLSMYGDRSDFIGHIGGDDFIVVTTPEKVEPICSYITKSFDQRIPAYYEREDRERGYIETTDRQGTKRIFPMMTVSIGVSTNEKREIEHYGEIIDILIEMKKYAKSLEREGSTYVKDRRTSKTRVF